MKLWYRSSLWQVDLRLRKLSLAEEQLAAFTPTNSLPHRMAKFAATFLCSDLRKTRSRQWPWITRGLIFIQGGFKKLLLLIWGGEKLGALGGDILAIGQLHMSHENHFDFATCCANRNWQPFPRARQSMPIKKILVQIRRSSTHPLISC